MELIFYWSVVVPGVAPQGYQGAIVKRQNSPEGGVVAFTLPDYVRLRWVS